MGPRTTPVETGWMHSRRDDRLGSSRDGGARRRASCGPPYTLGVGRMKLIMTELQARRVFVSREFTCTIDDLVTNLGWSHIEPAELYGHTGHLRSRLIDRLGALPDVILFWEAYWFINVHAEELDRLDCWKAVYTDDLHYPNEARMFVRMAAFILCDTVLCAYKNAFSQFYPEFAATKQVVWVPHAASPEFLLPFNESAENSILLSGALGGAYPFREQMKSLCDSGIFPIVHVPHPGYHQHYNHSSDGRVGAGYARTIHRFRTAFTDWSLHRYLVAKHFEIPATGCLLLAERAAADLLEELGMIAGEHYIAASPDDIEETIRFVLDGDNHKELDELRRRGQQLVRESHTTRERARLIDATFHDRSETK